jgi:ABC-2 type transport system permease protein
MTMTTDTIVQLPARKRLAVASVFNRSVADRMGLTLWIGIGVGLMSFMVAAMYSSLEETLLDFDLGGAMEAFLFGSDIASPVGWLSTEMYSMMVPMAIVALVVIDGGRLFAGEEEGRSIGLLAANPLSRTRLLVDKVGGMVVHVVVASVLSGVLLWAGVVAFSLEVEAANIAATHLHVAMLGIMFGGAILVASVILPRRIPAMLAVAGFAGVAFIVATFMPIFEGYENWAKASPWYFFYGNNPLANGVNWTDLTVMAAIGAGLYVLGWFVFIRRDLPG